MEQQYERIITQLIFDHQENNQIAEDEFRKIIEEKLTIFDNEKEALCLENQEIKVKLEEV